MSFWKGRRILVTGACGTVGSELLVQLLRQDPLEIIGLDNNERGVFFADQQYREDSRVRLFLGDVRDPHMLMRKMEGIDVVIHAAALKHVILCERSPGDAVQTNIAGVQNVLAAAAANGVERVLFTSSDKAVNPTSVMGTSKLMGERLLSAANANRRDSKPIYASTRFGNVLGSAGSVVPVFREQISRGGPVTLTDPGMTRFIMTLPDAVNLVMESVTLARGGEVFVTKMPVLRIEDLARAMIELLAPAYGHDPDDIEVSIIGSKPGEKLYEELINDEEVRRTIDMDRYFVVVPALQSDARDVEYHYPGEVHATPHQAYNSASEDAMSYVELKDYLIVHGLVEGWASISGQSSPTPIATADLT